MNGVEVEIAADAARSRSVVLGESSRAARRRWVATFFHGLFLTATLAGIALLALLLAEATWTGWAWLDTQFLTSFPSRFPEQAGIKSALWGTVWLVGITALVSIPLGVAAAVYLEEYATQNRLNKILEINIANLAGVPSIVYGLLGLALFVRWFRLDRSVLAGGLTMSLLILPVVIISSREAIRAVPMSLRHAAFALGATRWQTVRHHVLPSALPGILTGVILAMSRAFGEAAPLIMIGALTYVAFVPEGPFDAFTALPIQIFNWASRPRKEFGEIASAGIIVLLGVLLLMNITAVVLRHRFQRYRR